jgi:hypothetical protein
MRARPLRGDTLGMRRVENMKTMTIDHVTAGVGVRRGSSRTVPPLHLTQTAVSTGTALEQQLDEIQRTFGARWEW